MFHLYQARSFSEKFNVCTAWLAENWKPYFKHFTLLMLPLCIVQGYFTRSVMTIANGVGQSSNYMPSAQDISNISLCYLVGLIATLFSSGFFYAIIKKTFIKHETITSCSFKEFFHATTKNLLPLLGILLAMIVILTICLCIVLLPAFASSYALILTIPIFIAVCIALLPLQPLFMLTDEPFLEAIAHSFRLGFKCWWGFFSTAFVMAIITLFIQLIAYIPSYAVSAIDIFMKMSGTKSSLIVDFLSYLSNVFLVYVNYASSILLVLIVALQYGHAVMKIDKEEPLNVENPIG